MIHISMACGRLPSLFLPVLSYTPFQMFFLSLILRLRPFDKAAIFFCSSEQLLSPNLFEPASCTPGLSPRGPALPPPTPYVPRLGPRAWHCSPSPPHRDRALGPDVTFAKPCALRLGIPSSAQIPGFSMHLEIWQ